MGKSFAIIMEQDEALKIIRHALNEASIKICQEVPVQYGIKFLCDNGATFILYFSKGKSSKIFFEKESRETVTCIEKICNIDKKPSRGESVPIYASYQIPVDQKDIIKQNILECFTVTEKETKKDTILYIFELTEGDYRLTITQFNSGKLLLQGLDSILVTKVKEIIYKYYSITNKEEALTYVPQEQHKETERVIEQIEGFDDYCDKARNVLSKEVYDYLPLLDKKQIVTAFGLLKAIKENSISLPLYNPIVYPVAKAFEGFVIKMMIDKKAFSIEDYRKNPEIAQIGNWLREEKFNRYIKDLRRDGSVSKLLIAAWEGIRCEELHSDPARYDMPGDLLTIDMAEAKIGTVCDAIISAHRIIIKNGYTEEEMLARKTTNLPNKSVVTKEIPFFECHIGTDESGKGDYFGPLVVAGVYITKAQEEQLSLLGVRDSKSNSDSKNKSLATQIIEILGKNSVNVVCIGPERYNSLYDEMGKNLNKVLGWGHARVMENLLSLNSCENAIADQFGDETVIKSALMKKGKSLNLIQTPKGERDIGVAAASILARARFLDELDKLGKVLGVTLSKGVSPTVESTAKDIYENGGFDKLKQYVKLHFKTTQKIMS